MLKQIRNSFFLISRYASGASANQMARALQKLSSSKKTKQKWYNNSQIQANLLPVRTKEPRCLSKQGQRRINVLNKLYMRYITDIMATGQMSEQLLGNNIEITKVKVTSDFNTINVYWVANGMTDEDNIKGLLKRAGGFVRHELSNLQTIGLIPHINFVKDTELGKNQEVEQILRQLEEQAEIQDSTNSQLNIVESKKLNLELPEHIVKQISSLETKEPLEEEDIPPMKYDTLGLDQLSIGKRITNEISKTRKAWNDHQADENDQKL